MKKSIEFNFPNMKLATSSKFDQARKYDSHYDVKTIDVTGVK